VASDKSLEYLLHEAEEFIALAPTQDQIFVENQVLKRLMPLAIRAEEAASSQSRGRYLDVVNGLRDICVKVGHPNTLKEAPLYQRIEFSFPEFVNPLRNPLEETQALDK